MSAYDQFLAETKSQQPTGTPKVVPVSVGNQRQPDTAPVVTSAYDRFKQETSVSPMVTPKASVVTPQVEKPSIVSTIGTGLGKVLDWFGNNQKQADEASLKLKTLMTQGKEGLASYENATPEEKAKLINQENQNVPLVKFLNSDTGKKITSFVARNSANIPLKAYASIKALGDNTYDEAYKALEEKAKDPNNTMAEKIFYGVQDSGTQSALGILLGLSVSAITRGRVSPAVVTTPYFASISAEDQRQEKGRVDSLGNIAIDTVGDTVLSGFAESALKSIVKEGGETALKRILKEAGKGFTVEGGTEVSQSFLKYANDYKNAQSEEQKQVIVKELADYVKNGGMAQEFLIGGIAGGLITGGASAIGGGQVDPNLITKDEAPIDPKSAYATYLGEKGVDLSKPAIEIQKEIEKVNAPEGSVQADGFAPLEGVNPKSEAKVSEEDAVKFSDTATERYWSEKIQPAIDKGEPIVIGGDDLKDHFGRDYNDNNHPIYSKSAFKLFELALQKAKGDTVVFTSGGAGSGKTELVTKALKARGFDGIVYDSNLSNYEGALKQIKQAEDAGKKVEIRGVLPNIENARKYTILRENEIGRGISDNTFARGHAGAPAVIEKLLEEGKIKDDQVKILDTRNVDDFKVAMDLAFNEEYITNVLDTLKGLGYNEDNLKTTYAKNNFDQTTGQRTKGKVRDSKGSSETPAQDRTDKGNANRGTNGKSLPTVDKQSKKEKVKTLKEEKPAKKEYKTTYNLNDPSDFEYLSRIFSEETMQDMKKGIFKSGRREGKETIEEIANGYIVSKPFKKIALKTTKYIGTRTFYHGTSTENVSKITKQGFKVGSSLPEDAFRSGGYGQMQDSVSFSSDPIMASIFTGSKNEGSLIKVKIDPKAKIVSASSIEDAIELNDHVEDLKKKGVDAVWIGGGEKELVVISPKIAKVEDSRLFNVQTRKEDLAGFGEDIPKGTSGYASIGRFREEGEVKLGNIDQIKPIEFPELIDLAKTLSGDAPFIKKYTRANGMFYGKGNGEIGLNPDLFLEGNIGQLQKTLAHEIGHLIDYLPDHTMSRGNVLGRLSVLKGFSKDFYAEAGVTRSNKEVRNELWELSKYWKPVDETTAPKSYIAYRKSAPEVYADFISVLFNNPVLAGDKAPASYNIFFESLDKKPEVKKAYFELQDLLRNDAKVMEARKDKAKNMFVEADQKAKDRQNQIELEEEMKKRSIWFKFKFQNVSRFEAIRELVKEKQKAGEFINPDDNPVYYLEESNYLGGHIKSIVDEKFNSIYQELQKNGMDWDDLGEIAFYERILKGDRGEVANPEGLQIDFVRELYDDLGEVPADADASKKGSVSMRTKLGDVKFERLQQLAQDYRDAIKDLYREAHAEGMVSDDAMKMIEESDYYVPFKPVKYAGVKTSYRIKSKKGTLQPIENPANTGIEKSVSLIRAMERNKVNRKTINFLKENFSDQVEEAKYAFNGKARIALEPTDKNLRLVSYMEDGKMKAYYVDQYIGEAIRKTPVGQQNMVLEGLRFMNSGLFRPLFITFNVGFQQFNLIRDYWRSIKSFPDTSLVKSLYEVTKNYGKSFNASKIRAFGIPENPTVADQEAYDLVNKLERDRIIAITYNDIIKGEDIEDRQIDRIMREVGVREAESTKLGVLGESLGLTKQSPVIKQMIGIMDFIEKTGNLIETMPKIAGYYALEGKVEPREMRSFIRRKVGSPDFLDGGRFKGWINEVFLFSNAIFQGVRADYELAVDPKTRSGYWWKTMQLNFLPKILMLMATYGLFGDYLKELFGKVSEYDKTNYHIVPLGKDENGKAIYVRIPQDETGRLMSGLLWKIAGAIQDPEKLGDLDTYLNILSYAGGQAPSLSPAITGLMQTSQYVSGQNPYDFFRGRTVLSDEQMLAGGSEKLKPFLSYMFDNLGGSVFMKLYKNEVVPKDPSPSERVLALPAVSNLYSRFIRVSNYGETEKIREITNEVRSDKARESLQTRREVFDYVDQAQGKSYGEQQAIKKKMIEDILGSKINTKELRDKKGSLEKRFNTLLIRGEADPKVDALVTAQSNDEKVALLTEYQKTLPKKDFEDLRKFIIKNRIVSSDAYRQFIVNSNKK